MTKKNFTRKMLYVRDEDIVLYEQAEKLGSLSSVVADLLRDYLTRRNVGTEIYQPITMEVGHGDHTNKFTFDGKLLIKNEEYTLYHTVKSNIVLYTHVGQEKGFRILKSMDDLKDLLKPDEWEAAKEELYRQRNINIYLDI